VLHGHQLTAAIRSLVSRPLRDRFYRAMLLKYAGDPLGRQRPITANRFNIENGARVLYLAETSETTLHEVRAFGFPALSVTIVPIAVKLKAIIDLRDANTLKARQLTSRDLSVNFRAAPSDSLPTFTQELGERCATIGCVDGILYESLALPGTANLAVIEAGLTHLKSSVTVNDPVNNLQDTLP
jgi:RES domain-containing protein